MNLSHSLGKTCLQSVCKFLACTDCSEQWDGSVCEAVQADLCPCILLNQNHLFTHNVVQMFLIATYFHFLSWNLILGLHA